MEQKGARILSSEVGLKHVVFTQWAKKHGVQIKGVRPAQISGHGLGIIAEKGIEVQIIP